MNHMKQIANILGVEMGEAFEITTAGMAKSDGCFELTENGIKRWVFPSYNKNIAREDDEMLAQLLNWVLTGEKIIVKLPWKPANGERYYMPCVDSPDMYDFWTWQDDDELNQYRFKCGLVFKTEEEAIELTKKMLAAAKNEQTCKR